jgi:nucleoside-diphosphate-sugar epimerase
MRILLTGPDGFIGAAFARQALNNGHEVAGVFLPGHAPGVGVTGIRPLTGTLAAPPWEAISHWAPEVCVHTAWVSAPGEYLESPANEQFLEWSRNWFERVVDMGVGHLVGLGTCVEYQMGTRPLDEMQTPVAPGNRYARCKDALRQWGEKLALTRGVKFAWARIFYPYGPGEHPERLCSSLIRRLSRGERVILRTPESRKDYIYVDDVARAILQVLESGWAGCVNVGTGTGVRVGDLGRMIARLLDREKQVQWAEPPAEDPFPWVVADATRLRSLGWCPRVNLETGLRQLVETLNA